MNTKLCTVTFSEIVNIKGTFTPLSQTAVGLK